MTFSCTYRDNNGSLHCTEIKASNRKEALESIHVKGFIPVRICVGTTRYRGLLETKRLWIATVAVGITIFLGIVVLLLLDNKLNPRMSIPSETVVVRQSSPGASQVVHVEPSVRTTRQNTNTVPSTLTLQAQKIGEVREGKLLMPDGSIHIVHGEVTNNNVRAKGSWAIFKHASENVIAATISVEPGQILVGTPHFNGNFTRSFLRSLTDPIVVNEDDPPERRMLKLAVIEAKKQLKEAYDHGEDIEKIILDSREECQRLAQYRQQLKSTAFREANRAESEQEADDVLKAANILLESKGIAPLDSNPLTRIKLRMMNNQQNHKNGD